MAKPIIEPGRRAALRAEAPDVFLGTLERARWRTEMPGDATDSMRAYDAAWREAVEAEATRRIRFARETLETLGMAGRRAA